MRCGHDVEAQGPGDNDAPQRLGVVQHVNGVDIVRLNSRWWRGTCRVRSKSAPEAVHLVDVEGFGS